MTFTIRKTHAVADGVLHYVSHDAPSVAGSMDASIFIPAQASTHSPVPVITWLSGLTCTEDNFTTKAGAYKAAAQHGVIIIAPDTSPRGGDVANDDAYDLGQGAGFYLTATQEPWAVHYKMDHYVTQDLQALVFDHFPGDKTRQAIMGHSMGGHGALTLALKNRDLFHSVSAFSPIVAPSQVPWGEKAFTAYLGADRDTWVAYDACALLENPAYGPLDTEILIEQGLADDFLDTQLKPDLIEDVAARVSQKLTVNRRAGYDHSYFFISSFIADHIAFHAKNLG